MREMMRDDEVQMIREKTDMVWDITKNQKIHFNKKPC